MPRLDEEAEACLPEALEGVGRGAGLERAAAQDRSAQPLEGVSDPQDLLLRLDGAGARHQHDLPATHPRPVRELDDRRLLAPLAADLLVRLGDVDDLEDAGEGDEATLVHLAVVPDEPDRDPLLP